MGSYANTLCRFKVCVLNENNGEVDTAEAQLDAKAGSMPPNLILLFTSHLLDATAWATRLAFDPPMAVLTVPEMIRGCSMFQSLNRGIDFPAKASK